VVDVELVDLPHVARGVAVGELLHGGEQPLELESLAIFVRAEELHAPLGELDHGRLEAGRLLGQLVDGARRGRIEATATDQPGPLELLQALAQEVRRDAVQTLLEIGEALGREEQLAHDEHGPAVPDDVEGAGEGAVLVVAPGHRGSMIQVGLTE
jgi:hypothetical protein